MLVLIIYGIKKDNTCHYGMILSSMIRQCNFDYTKRDMGESMMFPLSHKILRHLQSDKLFILSCMNRMLVNFDETKYSLTPFGFSWTKELICNYELHAFLTKAEYKFRKGRYMVDILFLVARHLLHKGCHIYMIKFY